MTRLVLQEEAVYILHVPSMAGEGGGRLVNCDTIKRTRSIPWLPRFTFTITFGCYSRCTPADCFEGEKRSKKKATLPLIDNTRSFDFWLGVGP